MAAEISTELAGPAQTSRPSHFGGLLKGHPLH